METITRFYCLVLSVFALAQSQTAVAQQAGTQRPNFVVIVADDMGFSDMGAFGGEINTPNLDKLAGEGVRYTNFYVAPTCSPTRSMLMTGMDNHLVGMGCMYEYLAPNQENQPGYEGVLSTEIPTMAEILQANGYHTYMTGKWHLGKNKDHIPAARGFERSFSMLSGSGSYFSMNGPDEESTPNHY
ncbi:MAG: sulfatase-like hydrolase/transferase, partial [Saprospiraceae bacterium]|nr:sulfatase-like hydrolase/transferase [Saprospiraceae bacterium]